MHHCKGWYRVAFTLASIVALASATKNPQVCETANDDGYTCKAEVKISCVARVNNQNVDCLNPDNANKIPWIRINKSECGPIPLTLTFKMCNRNTIGDLTIRPDETKFAFNGGKIPMGSNMFIGPEECRVRTITRVVNTCLDQKELPMQVLLNAHHILDSSIPLSTGINTYCYCFTFKKSTFEIIDDSPILEPCSTKNHIITEISNPEEIDARYIEVYSPGCQGKYIEDGITLSAYMPDSSERDVIFELENEEIPDDGFLVFCKNKEKTDSVYGAGTCDHEIDTLEQLGSTGKVSYAVYDENNSEIIDIYGSSSSGPRDSQDCAKGRAMRKPRYTTPSSVWERYMWVFTQGADEDDMDPRAWVGTRQCHDNTELIITEIADPLDKENNRFLEVYSPNQRNCVIQEDLAIIRWIGSSSDCDDQYLSLKYKYIDSSGFLVICKTGHEWDEEICDIELGKGSVVDNDGDNSVAIAMCTDLDDKDTCNVLDIYGHPGQNDQTHDFSTGRAFRKVDRNQPKKTWVLDDWVIEVPAESSDCTPRSRADDKDPSDFNLILSEIADPIDDKSYRFIELFSPSHTNYVIKSDLYLVRYDGSNPVAADWFSLKYRRLDENGFFVICSSSSVNTNLCDVYDNIGNISGDDRVALAYCPYGCGSSEDECYSIDVYGRIGEDSTESDFTNGRAYRLPQYTNAQEYWILGEWEIVVPQHHYDCTPRNRNDPDPIIPGTGTLCEKRPTTAWYRVTGDSCDESDNGQIISGSFLRNRKMKSSGGGSSNGFTCTENNWNSASPLTITINNEHYGTYNVNTVLVVTDSPTNMDVTITRPGGREQRFEFHSSCSKPLAIGDKFGSLTLEAFENEDQGLVPEDYQR